MKDILQNRYIVSGLAIAFGLWIISAGLVISHFHTYDASIILRWDVYRGVEMSGGVANVWALVGVAFLVLVIDTLFAIYLLKKERFLAHLFSFFSAAFSLLVLMAIGAIVYFN